MKRYLGSIAVLLMVIVIHFVVSSMLTYYVANQVGKDTGNAIVGAYYSNTEGQSERLPDQEAHMLYNDVNIRTERSISAWKIPLTLMLMPIKPLFKPIQNRLMYSDYQEVVAKRMSPERFLARRKVFAYFSIFVNSVGFGLCVYLGIAVFKFIRRPGVVADRSRLQ